jgi:hypothetical protein
MEYLSASLSDDDVLSKIFRHRLYTSIYAPVNEKQEISLG